MADGPGNILDNDNESVTPGTAIVHVPKTPAALVQPSASASEEKPETGITVVPRNSAQTERSETSSLGAKSESGMFLVPASSKATAQPSSEAPEDDYEDGEIIPTPASYEIIRPERSSNPDRPSPVDIQAAGDKMRRDIDLWNPIPSENNQPTTTLVATPPQTRAPIPSKGRPSPMDGEYIFDDPASPPPPGPGNNLYPPQPQPLDPPAAGAPPPGNPPATGAAPPQPVPLPPPPPRNQPPEGQQPPQEEENAAALNHNLGWYMKTAGLDINRHNNRNHIKDYTQKHLHMKTLMGNRISVTNNKIGVFIHDKQNPHDVYRSATIILAHTKGYASVAGQPTAFQMHAYAHAYAYNQANPDHRLNLTTSLSAGQKKKALLLIQQHHISYGNEESPEAYKLRRHSNNENMNTLEKHEAAGTHARAPGHRPHHRHWFPAA